MEISLVLELMNVCYVKSCFLLCSCEFNVQLSEVETSIHLSNY